MGQSISEPSWPHECPFSLPGCTDLVASSRWWNHEVTTYSCTYTHVFEKERGTCNNDTNLAGINLTIAGENRLWPSCVTQVDALLRAWRTNVCARFYFLTWEVISPFSPGIMMPSTMGWCRHQSWYHTVWTFSFPNGELNQLLYRVPNLTHFAIIRKNLVGK